MKRLSLLLLFLLSIITNAQDISVDITKSKIYKDRKKHTNLLYSEKDGKGGLIIVRNAKARFKLSSTEYYIDHYSSDLSLIESYTLKNEKWAALKGIIIKDNTINLIQQISKNGKVTVNRLVSPIDQFNFRKIEMFKLNKQKLNEFFSMTMKGIITNKITRKVELDNDSNLSFSHNKNYFTFTYKIKGKKKASHLFLVYNNSFEKVYEKVFTRDVKDRLFDVTDVTVDDNDASVYMLGKVFENNIKKAKIKKKTNYHYELYRFNDKSQNQVSFKNKEFVHSLYILQRKKLLYLVGFYSEKNDNRTKGVCRFKLDSDLTITDKQFNPFSNQFLKDKYKKGKDVSDRKKEIRNVEFRAVFLDDNNNIIINAEEFYITTEQTYTATGSPTGGTWTTTTTYHYVDIITTKMDSKGKLVWARNINKHQGNPYSASYASTVIDDKVYYILNASEDVSSERGGLNFGRKLFNFKRINLYIFTISNNGDIQYKKLIDRQDLEVIYNVANVVVSDDFKHVYMQGRKKRKKRLLRLDIK